MALTKWKKVNEKLYSRSYFIEVLSWSCLIICECQYPCWELSFKLSLTECVKFVLQDQDYHSLYIVQTLEKNNKLILKVLRQNLIKTSSLVSLEFVHYSWKKTLPLNRSSLTHVFKGMKSPIEFLKVSLLVKQMSPYKSYNRFIHHCSTHK